MRTFFKEETYAEQLRATIEPYIEERREEGQFQGKDGATLYYARYTADEPRGTVAIVHGFSETAEKYREVIYYFLREGWSVATYDQRGHGRSLRVAPADVTHVEQFSQYTADLSVFCEKVLAPCPKPHLLFAHSMGGAVAALYLEEHDGAFARAVLSSPMIAPSRNGVPLWAARALCRTLMAFGKGKNRIFVSAPATREEKFEDSCALSRARFNAYFDRKQEIEALWCGAPTYAWTYASLGVTKQILAKGKPEGISVPVKLFTAKRDTVVEEAAQTAFISRVPHGSHTTIDAKHEIYFADDTHMHPYMNEVLSFFDEAARKENASC